MSFVFNYQGAEGLNGGHEGQLAREVYAEAEYGATTGIYRILRVLKGFGVRATFMVCGALAEYRPDTVAAIHSAGHEVAGHGYHHEIVTTLPESEERELMRSALDVLESITGRRPVGWRSCHQSANTTAIALDAGLSYNSNSFLRDFPSLLTDGARSIVEIPRQPFGDMRVYGSGPGTEPIRAFEVWRGVFDTLYDESQVAPTYCPYSFHPFITGRPGRSDALARLLDYVLSHDATWVATCHEVAGRILRCDPFADREARATPATTVDETV